MRFLHERYSCKSKKKYLFCYEELLDLSQKIGLEFIKDSNKYAAYINDLVIVEYFPRKFEDIRQMYTHVDIVDSLFSPFNYQKLRNLAKEEGGRSEAFIFSTYNQRLIIKTITKVERKQFILKMLPDYIERIKEFPESKLVRILGVFKVHPMKQNIVIMENLLINKNHCVIFDLKGSKVSRIVKGLEDSHNPPLGRVLKDLNFLEYGKKIKLNEESKLNLIETLRMDFELLRKLDVIDYSLLVGIYKKNTELEIDRRGSLLIGDDGTRFSLGIIDIFQEYNYLKVGEKTIKTIFNKKEDISIASPKDYSIRISEFCCYLFE